LNSVILNSVILNSIVLNSVILNSVILNSVILKEECGPCPVLASYTLAFTLQPRKKHGKTSVREDHIIIFLAI